MITKTSLRIKRESRARYKFTTWRSFPYKARWEALHNSRVAHASHCSLVSRQYGQESRESAQCCTVRSPSPGCTDCRAEIISVKENKENKRTPPPPPTLSRKEYLFALIMRFFLASSRYKNLKERQSSFSLHSQRRIQGRG